MDGGRAAELGAGVLAMLALLAGACDPISVEPAPSPDPSTEPEAVEDPGDAPCETLSRGVCMGSLVCTLASPSNRPSNTYVCRPAMGNCEVGLTQTEADHDRCDQRTGCLWRRGHCYCDCRGSGHTSVPDGAEARACDCDCGGGPPPGCVAR